MLLFYTKLIKKKGGGGERPTSVGRYLRNYAITQTTHFSKFASLMWWFKLHLIRSLFRSDELFNDPNIKLYRKKYLHPSVHVSFDLYKYTSKSIRLSKYFNFTSFHELFRVDPSPDFLYIRWKSWRRKTTSKETDHILWKQMPYRGS